jgi:hypothetical protein
VSDDPPDPDVEALAAWDPAVLEGVELGADRRRREEAAEGRRREARLGRWPVVDEPWARRVERHRRAEGDGGPPSGSSSVPEDG